MRRERKHVIKKKRKGEKKQRECSLSLDYSLLPFSNDIQVQVLIFSQTTWPFRSIIPCSKLLNYNLIRVKDRRGYKNFSPLIGNEFLPRDASGSDSSKSCGFAFLLVEVISLMRFCLSYRDHLYIFTGKNIWIICDSCQTSIILSFFPPLLYYSIQFYIFLFLKNFYFHFSTINVSTFTARNGIYLNGIYLIYIFSSLTTPIHW